MLTNDIAVPSPVANLKSEDLTLDTNGRHRPFKRLIDNKLRTLCLVSEKMHVDVMCKLCLWTCHRIRNQPRVKLSVFNTSPFALLRTPH